MSDYGKIETSFWDKPPSSRFDGRPRELAFFFRTSRHRNLIGTMRLPTAYISDDLKWPREVVDEALGVLVEAGYIVRDPEGWTHVPAQLEVDPPKVANHWKAAFKLAEKVPRTSPVFASLVRQLHGMADGNAMLSAWLRDAMPDGIGMASSMPSGVRADGMGDGDPTPSAAHGASHGNGMPDSILIPAPAPAPAPPLPSVGGAATPGGKVAKPTVIRTPKVRLPMDWVPDQLDIDAATSINLTGDRLSAAALKFRVYWTTGKGCKRRDAVKAPKDWRTAWANWCALENEFAQARGGSRGNGIDPAEQDRQDSLGVLRGMGYRPDGGADDADQRRPSEADRPSHEGDRRRAPADGQRAPDGRDPQARGVVPGDEHQADQRGDADRSVQAGAQSPAAGPADQGLRGDQEGAHLGQPTATAEGDIAAGERGVRAPGEDQARPLSGQPGGGGERADRDTGAAGGEHQSGGRAASELAQEHGRVGPQGEDLLDIPAFLRRTDAPVQVH